MTFEVLMALLVSTSAANASMSFFDSRIDYWNREAKGPVAETPKTEGAKPENGFPWKSYLDPKNKEFFKEGDYTPPEPFMEVARSPTDENLKSWFEFMQKKNDLARRLDQRMREYMTKNGMTPDLAAESPKMSSASSAETNSPVIRVDPKRFRFRMYFDSQCPHCHDMFEVLARLKRDGFSVEALQVDRGPLPPEERIIHVFPSSIEELKARGGKGFPYLEIADTTRQGILPAVEGFHDYAEIKKLLSEAAK